MTEQAPRPAPLEIRLAELKEKLAVDGPDMSDQLRAKFQAGIDRIEHELHPHITNPLNTSNLVPLSDANEKPDSAALIPHPPLAPDVLPAIPSPDNHRSKVDPVSAPKSQLHHTPHDPVSVFERSEKPFPTRKKMDTERKTRTTEPKEEPDDDDLEAMEREMDVTGVDLGYSDPTDTNITAQYFKDIGQIPLLTADEEKELAKQRDRGKLAEAEIATGDIDKRQKEMLETMIQQGEAAKEKLTTSNLRLVISVARKYMGRGLPFMDLVQEGNIGLQKGVEKFEWQRGFRFSTYAYWWIRQSISRAVADDGRTIRLPVHAIEELTHIHKAARELGINLGGGQIHIDEVQELADHMGIAREHIRERLQQAKIPISLHSPVGDGDTELGELLYNRDSIAVPDIVGDIRLGQLLDEALHRYLDPREVTVLRMRFGLGDGQVKSLGEVGEILEASRETIRQIEHEAIKKLRQYAPFTREFRDFH